MVIFNLYFEFIYFYFCFIFFSWGSDSGKNRMVHFQNVKNNSIQKTIGLDVSRNADLLFHPNGNFIGVYRCNDGSW
jgi:hypothetical protein